MKKFFVGVVVGVVAISVIILTVYYSDNRSEILTALVTMAVCGLPSLGIFCGWAMTMLTLKRAMGLVGAADRGYAAQMYRDREDIKVFGRSGVPSSQQPALEPGMQQPWLPPLTEFDVVDGESKEID